MKKHRADSSNSQQNQEPQAQAFTDRPTPTSQPAKSDEWANQSLLFVLKAYLSD